MHHQLSQVGFDLATDPNSLAYRGRVDHVSGGVAKGETLNNRNLLNGCWAWPIAEIREALVHHPQFRKILLG